MFAVMIAAEAFGALVKYGADLLIQLNRSLPEQIKEGHFTGRGNRLPEFGVGYRTAKPAELGTVSAIIDLPLEFI